MSHTLYMDGGAFMFRALLPLLSPRVDCTVELPLTATSPQRPPLNNDHFFGRTVHTSGADPGFFSGGGALVSCSTSTPINHIVFFFAEYLLY